MLQLRALHRSTAVPVVGRKGSLPAVQNLPQFLELIKAHGAGHVPLDNAVSQGLIAYFSCYFFHLDMLMAL